MYLYYLVRPRFILHQVWDIQNVWEYSWIMVQVYKYNPENKTQSLEEVNTTQRIKPILRWGKYNPDNKTQSLEEVNTTLKQ